ncbi:hypothetical protein RLV_6162 [Rhizobium leguminosarum bv. viciae]|nr:hypothetical protein RLV_6162 [Rhizobium leguminosarum bv. viciae]
MVPILRGHDPPLRCNCGGLLISGGIGRRLSMRHRYRKDCPWAQGAAFGHRYFAFPREEKAQPKPRLGSGGCGSGADQLVAGECNARIGDDGGYERQSDHRE